MAKNNLKSHYSLLIILTIYFTGSKEMNFTTN